MDDTDDPPPVQGSLFSPREIASEWHYADTHPAHPAGYEPVDLARLKGQMRAVAEAMVDGEWHTIPELARLSGGSHTGVSARIRDLRKERLGSHHVERERIVSGLYRYRLVPPEAEPEPDEEW